LLFSIQLRKVLLILLAIRNSFRYMLCLAAKQQQHNMTRCELHIMPAQPNAIYFTIILPSIYNNTSDARIFQFGDGHFESSF